MDTEKRINELLDELFIYFDKWIEKVQSEDLFPDGMVNVTICNKDCEILDGRYRHNFEDVDTLNLYCEDIIKDINYKECKEKVKEQLKDGDPNYDGTSLEV